MEKSPTFSTLMALKEGSNDNYRGDVAKIWGARVVPHGNKERNRIDRIDQAKVEAELNDVAPFQVKYMFSPIESGRKAKCHTSR
jgi:hypothetical protein